jgi:lysine 2,3-aminomutase
MLVTPNSWTSEFSRAFRDLGQLYQYFGWELEAELLEVAKTYSIFIPMNLARRIKEQGPEGVLAKEFLPQSSEINADLNDLGFADPIGDKSHLVAPQLIHRYPSRALFTATSVCPVHCRYCFRKNELESSDKIFETQFESTLSYIRAHPEISEIIFTGGDPLTVSNEKLEKYLTAFSEIKTIKDVRFHTRYPVILPERIDEGFIKLVNNFSEVFRTVSLAIHCNHSDEIDANAEGAILKLSQSRIQLLSQTVLLKGVNDDSETILNLMNRFLDLKVRPYYLHHPDRVKGGMHFYLSIETGRRIYQSLRKSLPGWALPHYVIDLPGGHGKISAYNPESQDFSGNFMTMDGETVPLNEPQGSFF